VRGGGGRGIYGSRRGLGLGRPGLGVGGGRPRCEGGSARLAWRPSTGDRGKAGRGGGVPGAREVAGARASVDAASEPVPSRVTRRARA
jgi:hypothetical protein